MILVDTSIWIPFFRADPSLFPHLHRAMEEQTVPALECVFGELLQGAKDARERKVLGQYWQNLPKLEERGLWIEAGILASEENLPSKGVGLIDAFLMAAAKKYGAKIWTLDKKLLSVLKNQEVYSPPTP